MWRRLKDSIPGDPLQTHSNPSFLDASSKTSCSVIEPEADSVVILFMVSLLTEMAYDVLVSSLFFRITSTTHLFGQNKPGSREGLAILAFMNPLLLSTTFIVPKRARVSRELSCIRGKCTRAKSTLHQIQGKRENFSQSPKASKDLKAW